MDKDVSEVEIRKRLVAGFGSCIGLAIGIYAILFATVIPVIMSTDGYAYPSLAEATGVAVVSTLAWPAFAAAIYGAGRALGRVSRPILGGGVMTVFAASWAQMFTGLDGDLRLAIGLVGLCLLAWFTAIFVKLGEDRAEELA